MKNQFKFALILVAVLVFGFTAQAQSQGSSASSNPVTVNLKLGDVISIENSAGSYVDINFQTAEDYINGNFAEVPNSLKVTSTKAFDIKVKADGAEFTGADATIPVDVLTIEALDGGTMGGTKNAIELSTDDKVLVEGAELGSELSLDIKYIIPAAKSSSPDILGKPAGTYTQTVTYTATAL